MRFSARALSARALGVFGENPLENRMKRSARLSLSNPDLSSPSCVPTGTPARKASLIRHSWGVQMEVGGRADLRRSPTWLLGARKHATALIKSSACAGTHAHRCPAHVRVNPGLARARTLLIKS